MDRTGSSSHIARFIASIGLLAGLTGFVACSSSGGSATADSGTGATGGGDAATSGDGATSGDAAVDSGPCVPPTTPTSCSEPMATGKACVLSVGGKVVDDKGAPLVGATVSVCGDVCFLAACGTGADGSFSASVGHVVNPGAYAAIAHGRPDHSNGLVGVPATASGAITLSTSIVAPAFSDDGVALPTEDPSTGVIAKGGDVTSGELTLTIPDGVSVTYDAEELEMPAAKQKHLRTAKLDLTKAPDFVTAANVAAAWALGPFDTDFSGGKLAVKINGAQGIAAGSVVEFLTLGYFAGYDKAQLVVAFTGKVSADGSTITSDAGAGLSHISWLAVRKKM